MSSKKDKAIFRYLLMKSLDGTISEEEIQDFNHLMQTFPDLEAYYFKCIQVHLSLKDHRTFVNIRNGCESHCELELLQEFGEYEKVAPAVQLQKDDEHRDIIQKVIYEKSQRQRNRTSLVAAIVSIAAVLLLILTVHLVSPRSGFEAATLTDSVHARWADTAMSMRNGTRLATGQETLLRSGFAELRFDNNAVVTVEGPAEFSIISEDRIKLLYGRIYSSVPQEAIGFSVVTPKAIVIDLGTQFGIQVDFQGTTELHVTKGKTTLVAGEKSGKTSIEVSEGLAHRVSGQSSELTSIQCNQSLFARAIDGRSSLVWRGESIDLADIVGGGNGWGTGRYGVGIDPLTGELVDTFGIDRSGEGRLAAVPNNRYIDGVFVPNGQDQPLVISSKGHTFAECPVTNDVWYMEIINSKPTEDVMLWESVEPGRGIYQSQMVSSIFMHANLGLTFDLQKIREDFRSADLTRFAAEVTLSPAATRDNGNVDAWVLVDGQVRFCQRNMKVKGQVFPVDIPLNASDRFLTLVTTDGGDVDYLEAGRRATDSDWCLFLKPRLEVEANTDESGPRGR
jgi:hypothetical protein